MDIERVRYINNIINIDDFNSFLQLYKFDKDIIFEGGKYKTFLQRIIYNKPPQILKFIIENIDNILSNPKIKNIDIVMTVVESENEELLDLILSKNVEVHNESINTALNRNMNISFIDELIEKSSKPDLKSIRKTAKLIGRTDIIDLINNKYLEKEPEAEHQTSDIIVDFIDNSNEVILELPNATYVLSHEIKRDIHIKGSENTKLMAAEKEGIFQVNQSTVLLEQLILESTDSFLIPVISGKLVFKNCKISIGALGIYGKNSTVELINCELIHEEINTQSHSVITLESSDLNLINSKIDIDLAFAQLKNHCKVLVELSEIEGNMNHPLFYSNNNLEIEIKKSKLFNASAVIQTQDNSNILVLDSLFKHFDRMIYCKDKNKIQVKYSEMNLSNSSIQTGRKCYIDIEHSVFSSADENHITIDHKSVINVKRSKFDNANMGAISGLKGSEINVEDCEIKSVIAGIVTQGGKINVERAKFIDIDEEGAIRGIKNDTISLKDVVIDSSYTDIIVDKQRKLIQDNVQITNPLTMEDI
ncbi:hypothetical protein GTN31_07170 [Macrococcoides canis]|uniref:hypothetical protein n=1 Tax=Macrococcoides canis TaxID=1855823 RepID=UPI0013E91B6F|nr:hypothetical protein [Macrococcus canis]QIH76139.1 hypothetical protein GTN31_07170 [Macrococcus canis]